MQPSEKEEEEEKNDKLNSKNIDMCATVYCRVKTL